MSEYKFIPPAFPQTEETLVGEGKGMTLRDYFAAQALGVILSALIDDPNSGKVAEGALFAAAANSAYAVADAMLKERAK